MTTDIRTKSRRSSPNAKLLGSREPTVGIVPAYEYDDSSDLAAVCAQGGLHLLDWQLDVCAAWTARTQSGIWASPTCGLSLARQNGKTLGTIEARSNYGMLILGEEIIYTAHLQKTATETFEDMAAFFDSPKIRRYLKDIKTALGREQIILKNGARIKFLARTRNGGRGQHGSLLIFDEAQSLTDEQQGSFLPCISASQNPQAIYSGTPPDDGEVGEVFRRLRKDALEGKNTRTCWHEWSVEEIGDVTDKTRWADTNPSYGKLIQENTVMAECEQMAPDKFAHERLGWWSPEYSVEHVISAQEWNACGTPTPPSDGKLAYAVKFAPDGSTVSLAVAVKPDEGTPHIELVACKPTAHGTRWLAEWLIQRKDKPAVVVVDGLSGAQALVDRIADEYPRKAVTRPRSGDVVAASTMLLNAIREQMVTWYSEEGAQDMLTESATQSTRRTIGGNGGWGFGGELSTPVEAAALALWGVTTTKRDARRKQAIW